MKKLSVVLSILLVGCKPVYHCNTETAIPKLQDACGVSVPINDPIFFINSGKPIRVYRVWDTEKPYTVMGRWWTLEEPRGSKEEYRKANAVCPEWSPLTGIVSAELKHDAMFFIGTTKGVTCEDVQYRDTSVIQVFIPEPNKALRNVAIGNWVTE